MPIYTLRDTESGRTIRVRADSPPNEQELDELFASTQEPEQPVEINPEANKVSQPFGIARVAEPEPFNPIQAEAVMNTPLVSPEALKAISPMSRILPPDSLAGGYERGLREIMSGVTTPAALSIAPAFTVPYLAPAAGMVFGAKTLGESAGRLTEAQTPAEAGGALAGVVVGTGMVAGGAPAVRRAAAEATPAGRLAYELREAQMSPAGLPTTAQVREAGLREAAMPEAVRMTQRALEARAKQILREMEAPKPTPERPLRSEDVTVKTRPRERIEDAVQQQAEAPVRDVRQPEVTQESAGQVPANEGGQAPAQALTTESRYRVADDVVDGRTVGGNIPNTSSISASLDDYTVLNGVREVPVSDFDLTGRHYSKEGQQRIEQLSNQIQESRSITPLIVVIEKDGPYILEGATRAEALFKVGAKSFPALVVVDNQSFSDPASIEPSRQGGEEVTEALSQRERIVQESKKAGTNRYDPDGAPEQYSAWKDAIQNAQGNLSVPEGWRIASIDPSLRSDSIYYRLEDPDGESWTVRVSDHKRTGSALERDAPDFSAVADQDGPSFSGKGTASVESWSKALSRAEDWLQSKHSEIYRESPAPEPPPQATEALTPLGLNRPSFQDPSLSALKDQEFDAYYREAKRSVDQSERMMDEVGDVDQLTTEQRTSIAEAQDDFEAASLERFRRNTRDTDPRDLFRDLRSEAERASRSGPQSTAQQRANIILAELERQGADVGTMLSEVELRSPDQAEVFRGQLEDIRTVAGQQPPRAQPQLPPPSEAPTPEEAPVEAAAQPAEAPKAGEAARLGFGKRVKTDFSGRVIDYKRQVPAGSYVRGNVYNQEGRFNEEVFGRVEKSYKHSIVIRTPDGRLLKTSQPVGVYEGAEVDLASSMFERQSSESVAPTVSRTAPARPDDVSDTRAEPASSQSLGIAPEGSELMQREAIQESKPSIEEAVSEMPGMEKGEVADALTDPNQAPILDVPPIEAQSGINPEAPIKAANVLAGAAGEQWTTFVDNMLVNMIDRVERGGTPFHRTVAEDARQAVNSTKRIQGRLREPYLNALKASAGGLSPARHRAVMDLARPIKTASGHQTTLMQEALDKRVPIESLNKDEKAVIRAYQDLLNATGKVLTDAGFMVLDESYVGGVRPFKPTTDGRVFLRLINHDFYEMLYHGGDTISAFAQHVASHPANVQSGWTAERLVERFREMGDEIRNTATPESAFRRINAEIPRELPFFPTHYRHPETGFNLEMLHVRPFDISQRIMETVSHRAGFVERFGQSISPENNRVKEIMEFMRKNPGQAREFTDMSRALNAQPVESTQLFEPGSKSAMVARVVNLTLSALKAHMLGVSTVPNIPEPLGRIQAQGTVPDVMKALWKVVGPGREAYIAALEELGATAIGDDIIDLTIDPARPIESLQRIHNDMFGRAYLYRFFWRFQHRLAAAIANEMVGRIMSGKGLDRDVPVLMSSMNLSRKEAERLVSGKATKEELDAFTRRAGAFTTNQPQLSAEMSRAEKAKWFRLAFTFTQYAMMGGRHLTREMITIAKTGKESKWGFSGDKKANAQMRGAMTNFLKTLLGGTMAGSLTTLMLAFLTGGKEGLDQKVREMKDEPVQFFRDSLLYFMLAGPYGAVLRTTKFSRGNTLEDVASYTFPGVMFLELNDMIKGSGRYRSASTATQKAGLLIDRFLPAKRIWTAALAGFGFGGGTKSEHLKLKQDISAYWRWRNDNDPLPKGQFPPPADFTRQMRQAYEKLLKGDDDAIEQIYRAMDVYDKTPAEARKSLLSRRLLTRYQYDPEKAKRLGSRYEFDPKLWESLQDRIGEDAMQTLMAHDALLEGMARSFR